MTNTAQILALVVEFAMVIAAVASIVAAGYHFHQWQAAMTAKQRWGLSFLGAFALMWNRGLPEASLAHRAKFLKWLTAALISFAVLFAIESFRAQPNNAAQSDAFRPALNAPAPSAPSRGREASMQTPIAAAILAVAVASVAHAQESSIGFKTVAEALDSLRATAGIEITTTKPDGWIIANDERNYTQWSFTPPGHYAYPAVVKRIIKQSADGNIYIQTTALCEAEKASCDKLMSEFEELTEQIRQNAQRRLRQGGSK